MRRVVVISCFLLVATMGILWYVSTVAYYEYRCRSGSASLHAYLGYDFFQFEFGDLKSLAGMRSFYVCGLKDNEVVLRVLRAVDGADSDRIRPANWVYGRGIVIRCFRNGAAESYVITAQMPVLILLLLSYPLWVLLLYGRKIIARQRRVRNGCCVHCGYDQRGNPTETCPECGWGSARI